MEKFSLITKAARLGKMLELDKRLELIVEVDVNLANASIKSVNTGPVQDGAGRRQHGAWRLTWCLAQHRRHDGLHSEGRHSRQPPCRCHQGRTPVGQVLDAGRRAGGGARGASCRAFAHSREFPVLENEYRNGESQRSAQTVTSRKRWRLA